MTPFIQAISFSPSRLRVIAALLAGAFAAGPPAAAQVATGWQLERGVDPASYAVVDPVRTDLNIDSVVLTCEEFAGRRGLQLQLYLTDDGPLAPRGVTPEQLKRDPRAEIAIDGRKFAVDLLFADDHVALADGSDRRLPVLSDGLLDAMQTGRTLVLRVDLVAEPAHQPGVFDGEAVVDLQAGAGGAAVAAVRRCTGLPLDPRVSMMGRH